MKNRFLKALIGALSGDSVSEPGDKHRDGMVFAGYLEGQGALYMTPPEATLVTKWDKAVEHAAYLDTVRAYGHTGWALPDVTQAKLLAKNMKKINENTGSAILSGYFWTAAKGEERPGVNAVMKTFNGRDNPSHEEWVGNQARSMPVLLIKDRRDPSLDMIP